MTSLMTTTRRLLGTFFIKIAHRLWPTAKSSIPDQAGRYHLIPKEGYVYGPMDRFLLVPKNRYRVALLPGQPLSDQLGVGWLTEDNSPEGYDQLWGDQSNLQTFRAEANHIRDKLTAEIADHVVPKLDTTANVVDIGCGIGDLLIELQKRVPDIQVAGLDFSAKAVEGAQSYFPKGTFQQYVIDRTLPYDSQSFDIVTCTDVLEHLEHPKDIVAELVRICRPGGYVFIVVPDGDVDTFLGHYWFWNAKSLHTLLAEWKPEIARLPQTREFIACLTVTTADNVQE